MAVDAAANPRHTAGYVGANIVIGLLLPEGEGAEVTSLFRAVSPAEFESLMATKIFQAGPNSLGGKFFAESAEHAAQWGTMMEGAGNFRIIEAQFPKSTADSFMKWERLDGIGPARYGELGPINAAKPTILPRP